MVEIVGASVALGDAVPVSLRLELPIPGNAKVGAGVATILVLLGVGVGAVVVVTLVGVVVGATVVVALIIVGAEV